MKKNLLFAFLFLSPFFSFSQYLFVKQTNIPVKRGTYTLKNPWTGGLNNPQFSAADIDNDDTLDLVIFDKTGDKVLTLLNGGTAGTVDYTYHPEFEAPFAEFWQWMLMADYDCDGIEDVLTYNGGVIDYHKGSYDASNHLVFNFADTLTYASFSGNTTIFASAVDIPAFVDMNNDGDLDVVTFDMLGGVVLYFENQSQELTGTCADTVFFHQRSTCWGDFYEPTSVLTNLMVLDSCGGFPVDTCVAGLRIQGQGHRAGNYSNKGSRSRDGAHAVLAFDEDGDGDKELIVGGVFFERMNRLVNGGNLDCAKIIDQDGAYPSYDKSYVNPLYPAAYYVDADNDSLKDLLVSPNTNGAENYTCAWYYKNVGTEDSVVFDFQTDSFLIRDMLDFGEGAHPVFFDYNDDGLLDLVVGNYGYYVNGVSYRSGLALLENIGTAQLPEYQLIDTDFGDVSNLSVKAIAPAFGDMDDDGDQDMIVGEFDGFLHYYENIAGAGNPANFTLTTVQMFDIDLGQFSTPFIYDLNNDGTLDLVVGEKNGNINYFENMGRKDDMQFDPVPTNNFLGQIDVRVASFPTGYSAPVICSLDTTNTLYLLTGNEEGAIQAYTFIPDSLYGGEFPLQYAYHSGIDEGVRSYPTVADITGDGKFEMVVGNYRGGVAMFSQSDSIVYPSVHSVAPRSGMQLFPNPATHEVKISLQGFNRSEPVIISLIDMLGRIQMEIRTIAETPVLTLPKVSSGMYFIKATQKRATVTKKLLITAR